MATMMTYGLHKHSSPRSMDCTPNSTRCTMSDIVARTKITRGENTQCFSLLIRQLIRTATALGNYGARDEQRSILRIVVFRCGRLAKITLVNILANFKRWGILPETFWRNLRRFTSRESPILNGTWRTASSYSTSSTSR
nr:uncharacterized protein LOC115254097 [Aedes albopictus]